MEVKLNKQQESVIQAAEMWVLRQIAAKSRVDRVKIREELNQEGALH